MYTEPFAAIAFVDLVILGFSAVAIVMMVKQRRAFGAALSPSGLICSAVGVAVFASYHIADLVIVAGKAWSNGAENLAGGLSPGVWILVVCGLVIILAGLVISVRRLSLLLAESP